MEEKRRRGQKVPIIPGRENRKSIGEKAGRKLSSSESDPRSRSIHSDQAQMDFVGQTDQGQMDAPLRFKIPVVETLEEHKSDKKGEDEIKDGRGLMLEAVIESEVSYQGVEQIVFDLPASMSDVPEQAGGDLGGGDGRRPTPVVELCLFKPLVVFTVPFGDRFLGPQNSQRNLNSFRCGKTFCIPGPDLRTLFFPNLWFYQREDPLGILKKESLFTFEDTDHMFVMV